MNKVLFLALLFVALPAIISAQAEGGEDDLASYDEEYWHLPSWLTGGSSSGSSSSGSSYSSGSNDVSSATGTCANYIKQNEGYVPKYYTDSRGYGTICWGHLYTQGHSGETFTQSQCQSFFNSDYATAYNGAKTLVSNFNSLTAARQCVLVDMTYNLGLGGIRSFNTFLGMVQSGSYSSAASDMLGTRWASQVHGRANRDANMMSSGNYQ